MPWAALDDGFHSNRKVLAMGLDGAGLYARAISYCADYQTDGFVPRTWALQVVGRKKQLLQKLVDVGAWVQVERGDEVELTDRSHNSWTHSVHENGFFLLAYLEYNQSTREHEANKKKKAQAGRKGALRRWGDSTTHRDQMALAMAEGSQVPEVSHSKLVARGRASQAPTHEEQTPDQDLELEANAEPGLEPLMTEEQARALTNAIPKGSAERILELIPPEHQDNGTPKIVRDLCNRLSVHKIELARDEILAAQDVRNVAKYAVRVLQNLATTGTTTVDFEGDEPT